MSVFFALIGCACLIPVVLTFAKLPGSDDADRIVFLTIGGGFLIPAVGFLLFGIIRFRRHRAFFNQQQWTGIRITQDRKLVVAYFNYWKVIPIELDLQQMIQVSRQSNKGQRFLLFQMNTKPKIVAIPIHHVNAADVDALLLAITSDTRSPIAFGEPKQTQPKLPAFLTEERLRVAETFMRMAEEKVSIRIPRKVFVVNEDEVTIGSESTDNTTPRIRVRWIGDGMGDSYSGNYVYQIVYQLENGPLIPDGRSYLLKYHYEATDQAGSTSHFASRMDKDEEAFEEAFYTLLRSEPAIPESLVNPA